MYVEIKTNDPAELHRVFDEAIKKGQQAMLTLTKERDFWSLSVNTTIMQTPTSSSSEDAP